jgi:hypothetical protein
MLNQVFLKVSTLLKKKGNDVRQFCISKIYDGELDGMFEELISFDDFLKIYVDNDGEIL